MKWGWPIFWRYQIGSITSAMPCKRFRDIHNSPKTFVCWSHRKRNHRIRGNSLHQLWFQCWSKSCSETERKIIYTWRRRYRHAICCKTMAVFAIFNGTYHCSHYRVWVSLSMCSKCSTVGSWCAVKCSRNTGLVLFSCLIRPLQMHLQLITLQEEYTGFDLITLFLGSMHLKHWQAPNSMPIILRDTSKIDTDMYQLSSPLRSWRFWMLFYSLTILICKQHLNFMV